MIAEMTEYCGQLIGGPNDGEYVEATVKRIPVANTSLLWLDGVSENTKVVSRRLMGTYVWNDDNQNFKWNTEGIGFNSRGT